jgi:hypothetical protein
LLLASLSLLLVACSSRPVRGATGEVVQGTQPLWAVSYVRQDYLINNLNGEQRPVYNWLVGIETGMSVLQADRARLAQLLTACPGPQKAWTPSLEGHARDGVRARPVNDAISGGLVGIGARPQREQGSQAFLNAAFQLSRLDWYLRRAAETQSASYCGQATEALKTADDEVARLRGSADEAIRVVGLNL